MGYGIFRRILPKRSFTPCLTSLENYGINFTMIIRIEKSADPDTVIRKLNENFESVDRRALDEDALIALIEKVLEDME